MASNNTPDAVSADISIVDKVWADNTEFKLKNVTYQNYADKSARLAELIDLIEAKDLELTPLRNERDQLLEEINDIHVRVRSGMKGYFGTDSSEYEQVGGTRKSERKRPSRKKASTPAHN